MFIVMIWNNEDNIDVANDIQLLPKLHDSFSLAFEYGLNACTDREYAPLFSNLLSSPREHAYETPSHQFKIVEMSG